MTKDDDLTDEDLGRLFQSARADVPAPDEAFLASLEQTAAEAVAQPKVARVRTGWMPQIRSLLGGWSGMGGLVAATAAGVWIGMAPPSAVLDAADLFSSGALETEFYGSFLELSEPEWQGLEDG